MTTPADPDRSEISELPEDSTHHALAQARPADPAEVVLAQARVLGAMAWLRWELGELPAAIEAMERARLVSPSTVPEASAYLTLWRGDETTAAQQFGDLVARDPMTPDSPTWARRAHAGLLLGLGQAQRRSGQQVAARLTLEPLSRSSRLVSAPIPRRTTSEGSGAHAWSWRWCWLR